MSDTFKIDINNILEYYEVRTDQFFAIQNAIYFFEKNDDQQMWVKLFDYVYYKDIAKGMFNDFSYDTLCTLADLDVQFIIGIPK